MAVARDLHERLFAWLTLADEQNLVETRIAGEIAWRRGEIAPSAG
jgi:guanine deaminase